MKKNFSLKNFNTLQVDCTAKYYMDVPNVYHLLQFIETVEWKENNHWILGGGSNTLFINNYFDGIVLHVGIKGIEKIKEDGEDVYIQVGAGENRNDFVLYCVEHAICGIENLVSIPGNVGTSAVSNIGAYGQEACDTIYEVIGVNLETNTVQKFNNGECGFGYRNSVFKNELKDKFIITHVVFKLRRFTDSYEFKTSYKDIISYFEINGVQFERIPINQRLETIARVVKEIRDNKLPDYTKIGTAGSFFKNPEIFLPEWDNLQNRFPELKAHLTENETMKLSAGQLIELCGRKGKSVNKVKMYEKHALILINEGGTGKDIMDYAQQVQCSVEEKFGIWLEPEVMYCS